MATLILVRHGRSTANTAGVLAGRSSGVSLDDTGRTQAEAAARRLAGVTLARIVSSPLERCRHTAKAIASAQPERPAVRTERGITECDYGEWTGRAIAELSREKVWKVVQEQPSAATFPGGESLQAMMARAVATVRRIDAEVTADHGQDAVWLAASHGDVIKSILADAFGMHLDLFQRINVDPSSLSIIRYTQTRPQVLATNTHEGDLAWLARPKKKGRSRKRAAPPRDDAVVGGGSGPE
ncbi:MAG: MSMEG_4193 family putative phosphomutase [Nocardioides sp.]|nr:MSMEG_4193 family putative phosphomutase [Nocardioides sp.]